MISFEASLAFVTEEVHKRGRVVVDGFIESVIADDEDFIRSEGADERRGEAKKNSEEGNEIHRII